MSPCLQPGLDAERATLGPPGLGLQTFPRNFASEHPCPVSPGSLLAPRWTSATKPNLIYGRRPYDDSASHPERSRPELSERRSDGSSGPTHQAGISDWSVSFRLQDSSALQASVGVQREIARDFVLSADFVYRHFVHLTLGSAVDLNHFNSIQGPVIPICTATQRNDPQAICSLGADQRPGMGRPRDLQGPVAASRQAFLARFSSSWLVRLFEQHRNK